MYLDQASKIDKNKDYADFSADRIKEALGVKELLCANLQQANLRCTDLREASLYCANLWGANLQGADLYRADLRYAHLAKADLFGASLWGADLRNAIGLTPHQLARATISNSTKLPAYITRGMIEAARDPTAIQRARDDPYASQLRGQLKHGVLRL